MALKHFFFVGIILRRHAESSGLFLCVLLLENYVKREEMQDVDCRRDCEWNLMALAQELSGSKAERVQHKEEWTYKTQTKAWISWEQQQVGND